MKRNKTKYPSIFTYETKKGKRYYVRRKFKLHGKQTEASASGLKTLAEARQALAEIENKIANGDYDPRKNMTVDDYWQIYSDNRIKTGRWAPDTIATKMSWYKYHFRKQFGRTLLKDIKRTKYEAYVSSMLKNYSRTSVIQISALFESMLTDAVINDYIDKNPILRIYIGKSDIPAKKKRLSLEDFRIWDKCAREILSSYDYTMVRLTYFGLRRSEVLGVKFGSLSLVDGRFKIFLDESRTSRRPEGGRMKTKTSERYVLVDEETTELLQKAMILSRQIAKETNRILGQGDFIFVDTGMKIKNHKGNPIGYSHIAYAFRKVSDKTNIYVTPHTMRHFFATQGQIAGVPVEHMAAALGHSTSYMTQKYTHIKDEVASEVTDSFLRAIK